ncbi:hypothetical protein A3J34_04740 [Candidatus Peribacteria bacterium RIFCSPLOWO2_02_FULL_51_10]|nr:MAG: hypothetical protein A3J34_04740 [Candidatus Peribacteria bacterium RIFCSPLOWO2_02_FULL_51_10]HLD63699.1 hypothetical protein [Candidatus Peribacteraceae bacterium]
MTIASTTKTKNRTLPERVRLRSELVLVKEDHGIHSETKYVPYRPRKDLKLEALIKSANGDPHAAIRAWFQAVEPRLLNRHSVHLIPGQIQKLCGLPVRQVYVFGDEVYRIDPDPEDKAFGLVTERLK